MRLFCLFAGLLLVANAAVADTVQVAVAANFAAPLKRLAGEFERRTGDRIEAISGSTGKLYAQIVAGAPFQVLLAADETTPRKLAAEGRAVADSQFHYARGRLVLWTRRTGQAFEDGQILAGPGYAHLAIANPRLAPYGAAAEAFLRHDGLMAAVAKRLVYGENIGQTFEFVRAGAADFGLVALSQVKALQPMQGAWWPVPEDRYPAITQDAILLQDGAAARRFLSYLKTPEARRLIEDFGYAQP